MDGVALMDCPTLTFPTVFDSSLQHLLLQGKQISYLRFNPTKHKRRSRNKSDDETVVSSLLLDIKPSKAVFVVPDQMHPDQLSTFTIDVKTLTGKTLQFDVNDLTTCAQLKTAIQDLEGIPTDQQRLIFGGAQLADGEFLRLVEKGNNTKATLQNIFSVGIKSCR
jgi:hypothetical protein